MPVFCGEEYETVRPSLCPDCAEPITYFVRKAGETHGKVRNAPGHNDKCASRDFSVSCNAAQAPA